MILPFTAPTITLNNLTNPAESMQIEMNGKVFKILSGSLYAYKIRAIIRELSTNAWDAHQDAGTANRPFDVQLPTRISPIFRIRDYGTGISEEHIFEIYNCLFKSTKTTTNNQTGMLGLGSKTPFAYTSSIYVTSHQNGIKKIYKSLMGNDGVPAISKESETATDEPNGLEIMFAVKPEDCTKFELEAAMVYLVFLDGAKPNILNTELKGFDLSSELTKVSDNLYFTSKSTGHATYNVIQGNVAYPLTNKLFPRDIQKALENISGIQSWFVKVPIGTVDFQPSREGLEEDEKNYAKLVPFMQGVVSYLMEHFRKKYSHFKHEMEATQYYRQQTGRNNYSYGYPSNVFSQYYFDAVLKENDLKYRTDGSYVTRDDISNLIESLGVEVERTKGDVGKYRQEERVTIAQPYTGPDRDRFTPELPAHLVTFAKHLRISSIDKAISNVKIVIVDDIVKYRKRINHHLGKNAKFCRIVLTKAAGNEKLVQEFLKLFPLITSIKTSEMDELPVVTRSTPSAPRILQRWFCDPGDVQPVQQPDWQTLEQLGVDDQKIFYYGVVPSNYTWLENGPDFCQSDTGTILEGLKKYGIIEDVNQFVLIRGAKSEQVKALPNSREICTFVRDYFKNNITKDAYLELVTTSIRYNDKTALQALVKFFGSMDKTEAEDYDFGPEGVELAENYRPNLYDEVGRYFMIPSYVYNGEINMYGGVEGRHLRFAEKVSKKYPMIALTFSNLHNHYDQYFDNIKKLLRKENNG